MKKLLRFFTYWFIDYPAGNTKHPQNPGEFLELIRPGRNGYKFEIKNKLKK